MLSTLIIFLRKKYSIFYRVYNKKIFSNCKIFYNTRFYKQSKQSNQIPIS